MSEILGWPELTCVMVSDRCRLSCDPSSKRAGLLVVCSLGYSNVLSRFSLSLSLREWIQKSLRKRRQVFTNIIYHLFFRMFISQLRRRKPYSQPTSWGKIEQSLAHPRCNRHNWRQVFKRGGYIRTSPELSPIVPVSSLTRTNKPFPPCFPSCCELYSKARSFDFSSTCFTGYKSIFILSILPRL